MDGHDCAPRVSICHKIRPCSNTQVKLAYSKKANVYCQSE